MDGDRATLGLYDELNAAGELPVRVSVAVTLQPCDADNVENVLITDRVGKPRDMVRCGAAKAFLDGVIETRTAWTLFEYPNSTAHGDPIWDLEDFRDVVDIADQKGLRFATHCVGDAAVRAALGAYINVAAKNGPRDRRWQIEHIEVIHPDDVPRFGRNAIIASMQPLHAVLTPDWTDNIPRSRLNDSFAWETLRKANATLIWASDWPVAPPDVIAAINELTTDRTPAISGGPDQRQTLDEAIRGYTSGGAFVEFAENIKGVIKKGALADLVLLSEKTISRNTKPVLTVCDGKITFRDETTLD
jgi:predicted amidohydrolase YtcJ